MTWVLSLECREQKEGIASHKMFSDLPLHHEACSISWKKDVLEVVLLGKPYIRDVGQPREDSQQ